MALKRIGGIGLFRFQADKAKEESIKELQINQMSTTSKLIKDNKRKDELITNLFITVNKLNKEIKELKGE